MSQQQKPQWDFGRFLNTLSYFGVVPFLGSFRWLQQLLGQDKPQPKPPSELVLVTGATGGVGRRVVRRLQQRGIKVRGLVRDIDRARKLLGNQVELFEGDIILPETLTPELFKDVTAIINCTGTKVQPVEGDTPNREKYYQGIKFYMPEVVDVPELVEYKGMQNLVNAVPIRLKNSQEKLIFDFTKPSEDLKETWGALDDVVMGGVSESSIRIIPGGALFTGNVSTENSGGFVSVRSRNFEPSLNLSQYKGIDLRVKGDGKRYKFIIRNEQKWDSVAYCYSFDTVNNIEMTIRIPFDQLIPVFRAKTLKNEQPFDPTEIYSFQLMLSKFEYDGELNPKFKPGNFQLQMESIKAYGGEKLSRFVLVSSAGVTRPGKPGLNLEEEPPAVRMNEQLGGILTWKLKGEDVVRSSGIPYTVVRPCALTEAAGNQALSVDQGDTIKGQISREDMAELCIQALNYPDACNVTFEVKAEEKGQKPGDWKSLFSQLKSD
ncbi:MAG: CIA30 family protein [Microcoleaceae cyanobacterium]